MTAPVHDLVRGCWTAAAHELVEQLRPRVRDVFFVDLDGMEPRDVEEFLRWAVPQLVGTEFESLLLEHEGGKALVNGLTRLTGRVVSLEWKPQQSWN